MLGKERRIYVKLVLYLDGLGISKALCLRRTPADEASVFFCIQMQVVPMPIKEQGSNRL